MEQLISGYCRCLDQARTVMAQEENGHWEQDCEYKHCSFSGSCTIAAELTRIRQKGV